MINIAVARTYMGTFEHYRPISFSDLTQVKLYPYKPTQSNFDGTKQISDP